jgi:hypothetical protein
MKMKSYMAMNAGTKDNKVMVEAGCKEYLKILFWKLLILQRRDKENFERLKDLQKRIIKKKLNF